MALDRWRGYLLDRHFQIKTNHFNLKYFLDQRITTPFQSKWLPKLLGFDYEILYKKGRDNQAANALSRSVHGGELSALVVSTIFSGLIEEVHKSSSQLRRKEKLMVGNDDAVRRKLVDHFYSSAEGGHPGVLATTKRLGNWLYWKGMKKIVKKDGKLPMSGGKFVILVVVDRLSKVEVVDKTLVAREKSIQLLQFYLKRAQNKMKSMADKHRPDREFVEGDWIAEATLGSFPHCRDDGLIVVTHIAVLDMKMVKNERRVAVQLLIQWANCSSEDATWEPYEEIQERYLDFAINP
ncbi:putative mitochondrial protein [Tanacetum coccineum]